MLIYGQIVKIANLLDPQRRNPKDRFAVLVTPQDEMESDDFIDIVAISTKFPNPLDDLHVMMPWHKDGANPSGLTAKCAAVCFWQDRVHKSRILQRRGVLPGRHLADVAKILRRLADRYN